MFPCKWKYFSWSLSYKGISNTSKNNAGKLRDLFALEYILAVIIEVSEVHFHQLELYSLILIDEFFDLMILLWTLVRAALMILHLRNNTLAVGKMWVAGKDD